MLFVYPFFILWVKLSVQKRLCLIFVKLWVPVKELQQCGIGLLNIHKFFAGSRLVNVPPSFRASKSLMKSFHLL